MNDVTKDLLEALRFLLSAHGEQLDLAFAQAHDAIARAEAEAKRAGPARLTDEVIERLWYSSRGMSTLFARAIETSILERNGFNPQAKGD